jgi:cold shock CspA family protein
MEIKRYEGKLKKWNAERGFGFIVAADGGQDVFVHISAYARDGRVPTEGEALTFEVEPDRNGKRSAVRVRRLGEAQPEVVRAVTGRSGRSKTAGSGSGVLQKLVVVLMLVAVAFYAYNRYANRVTQIEAAAPLAAPSSAPVSLFEPTQAAPASFSCDGRKYCSQMTSCKEAKLFLKNCAGVEMDGNHDGVPCEQQWCTHPFAD